MLALSLGTHPLFRRLIFHELMKGNELAGHLAVELLGCSVLKTQTSRLLFAPSQNFEIVIVYRIIRQLERGLQLRYRAIVRYRAGIINHLLS